MKEKDCYKCRHVFISWGFRPCECRHPNVVAENCGVVRRNPDACGPDGKWWKKKKEITR
jgi:hypothetical protein